jgi:hypothetical protein
MLERYISLAEGNGKNASVETLENLGTILKIARKADFVLSQGPNAHLRLISKTGFMIDIERFFDSTVSITRTDPSNGATPGEYKDILKRSRPDSLENLLRKYFLSSKKLRGRRV